MKILVADDDEISSRVMGRMLEQAGYEILAVGNGLDAVEQLRNEGGPRLALLDWMMPELDGVQVCREIRKDREKPYIYTIVLTAKDSKDDLLEAFEAGADDYLTKPCNLEELKARLRTGVRILQLEDKLVEAREAMRFEATHDALTSLWHRGTILNILQRDLTRPQAHRTPISILLCDVDHFKSINDNYGHLAGDAILKEVALRLHRKIRPEDAVGRYGGEEFLLILRGCGSHEIDERSAELRRAIEEFRFNIGPMDLNVTLSGGSLALDQWEETLTTEQVLGRVDEALYQAKAQGRNRIIRALDFAQTTSER